MNCRIIASLVAMATFTQIFAYSVKGRVENTDATPEAFATVRVFNANDSVKAAALGVTDDDGAFSHELPAAGSYKLIISSVGKTPISETFTLTAAEPVKDFGTMTIADNAEVLGEVDVVAMKPLVSKEIDRIGYDVQGDPDALTSNVQDILRKVPMVTVDADGTIKVKGSSNFKIYKNGRPNNAFTNNAKDIFAAIPASMIKKVEVITDPGAREDAEGVGAILNIVTTENTRIGGAMGSVSIDYDSNNSVRPSIWLTANIDRVNLSGYGGYMRQSERQGAHSSESEKVFAESGNIQKSTSNSNSSGNVGYWGIEGSWEPDSLNLFTMEFGGFAYGVTNKTFGTNAMYDPFGNTIYSYSANSGAPSYSSLEFNGALNYQRLTRHKDEVITLSYAVSHNSNVNDTESEFVDLYNFPAPYTASYSSANLKFLEQTFQADWTRPFANHHKFSLGGKLILRNNHSVNDNEYVGMGSTHDDFTHRTTVGAGYFDYRFNIERFSARAGLRYEYSHLGAKYNDGSKPDFGSNLSDWVPNASVMFNVNESSTLKLAYSSRINRPGITFLNPNVELTPGSSSTGNPDLGSVHHNAINLNYSLFKRMFNIDATLSYEFANNTISPVVTTSIVDGNDFVHSTYANIGRTRSLSLNIFAQYSPWATTSLMVNGSVFYNRKSIPGVENSRWGCNFFFRASQQLPWKLRLEGMLYYSTGEMDDVYTYDLGKAASIFHALSIQRSFLKEDRLTVKLMARCPFMASSGMEYRTVTPTGDYTGYSVARMPNARSIGISVSYRFGAVNAQVKKTAASIVNDDLQGGAASPSTSQSDTSF